MINKRLIFSQVADIRKSLKRLSLFANISDDDFSSNRDNFSIAEHHLRRSLEIFFDIGRHIIAKKFSEKPTDYQDIVKLLHKNKIISEKLFKNLENFARFRNRLVHLYWQVTDKDILEFIRKKAVYLEQFCREIIKYAELKNEKNKNN